jgi:hypothetical protein
MSCPQKNSFPDISKCNNLPLDNAFNNYNKKGGGDVVDGLNTLLGDAYDDSRLSDMKGALNEYNLTGGKITKGVQGGGGGGEGYYLAVGEQNIGGQAVVQPYDNCNAPVFATNCRDLRGGSKRRKRRKSRRSRRKSRRSRRNSRISRSRRKSGKSRRSRKAGRKSRRSRRKSRRSRRKSRRSRRRTLRGGNNKIDPYALSGLKSNFSPDMMKREFGARAPYWTPDAV